MALNFEDEVKGMLRHSFEQQPTVHKATTTGDYSGSTQEGFDLLGATVASHNRALIRVAQKIDNLLSAIEGG